MKSNLKRMLYIITYFWFVIFNYRDVEAALPLVKPVTNHGFNLEPKLYCSFDGISTEAEGKQLCTTWIVEKNEYIWILLVSFPYPDRGMGIKPQGTLSNAKHCGPSTGNNRDFIVSSETH